MDFRKTIISQYGSQGKDWLSNLPTIIKNITQKHQLTQLKPVPNLTYNYVAKGIQNNKAIILKICIDTENLYNEVKALDAFSNHSVNHLLIKGSGYIIIECAIPGTSLKEYYPNQENESIKIACNLIQNLHQNPINSNFPNISEWLAILEQPCEIPESFLFLALKLKNKLLDSTAGTTLLHGDLHHDNILKNANDWMIIDPKGVIGDPVFEVGAFIRNPIPLLLDNPNFHAIIDNRIHQFSKLLGYEEQRIKEWCYVQAIMCWCWALEDNIDPLYFQKLADTFQKMLNK